MERPGTWWKVRKGCQNDVGASGMDLVKFYMTLYHTMECQLVLESPVRSGLVLGYFSAEL